MTQSSTTPSRKTSRGGVARSEVNGHKTIKLGTGSLKGLEIKDCPAELPATFSWDAARIQARAAENDGRIIGDLYRLIESVIGDEGSELIRNRLVQRKTDPGMDLLMDTLNDITSQYGIDVGESEASDAP